LTSAKKTIFFLLTVILVFILLTVRCLYVQYLQSDQYVATSIHQRIQRPQRGSILDHRGSVLAASTKIKTVFAEPRIIEQPKITASKLAEILDIPAYELCRKILESPNPGFVLLKSDVNDQVADSAEQIRGVGVKSYWRRDYPAGQLTSHVVGFVSRDNRGLGGIELNYDDKLNGTAGQNIFFADVGRRPIKLKSRKGSVKDGSGLILTIDAAIQHIARQHLQARYKEYQAESAVAVVAEPRTGAILALVSLPDFTPEEAGSAPQDHLRNRALTDPFEPGSLLKPIVASIAIDAGVVSLHEKIFCENGHYSGKGFGSIGEYGSHAFGNLSVKDIVVKSSNIGMAKIGQKLGKQRLYDGLRRFGFGEKTGIDLPGESAGLLRPPEKWTGYSVTRIPFGQEISVTMVQLVRAFCVLASGGHAVKPHLVKAIISSDGSIEQLRSDPPSVAYVIRPEVAKQIVAEAMAGVVNEGTGTRAKLEKWQVFGKTGTANIACSDRQGYSSSNYVASFIAGAPAENPKLIVLVSITKPDRSLGKGYTGGRVASPVAAKILKESLTYLENRRI